MAEETTIARLLIEIGMDSDTARREAAKLEKELQDVAEAGEGVDKSAAKAEKSLKRLGTAANVAGKFANGLSIIMVGVATAAIGIGKAVLDVGGNFESLRIQLKTTTGSAAEAKTAFKFIKDFTSGTPFQLEAVTDAFIKLNNFGIIPTERNMTAFGDFAAAMGKSLDQFIEAVTDATTGEFERLKEFGIKTAVEGDRVKFTFRGITTEVGKNADEIQEFLASISEQNFGGAMEEQMGTLGGTISNLKDTFVLFLDEVANMGPLEEIKGLVDDLKSSMGDSGGLAQIMARTLTNAIRTLRRMLSGDLVPTLERIAKTIEFVIVNFDKLIFLFGAAKTVQAFSAMAQGFASMGIAASGALGPIGLIAAALIALIPVATRVNQKLSVAFAGVPKSFGEKKGLTDTKQIAQVRQRLEINRAKVEAGTGAAGITAPAILSDEKELKRLIEKEKRNAEAVAKFNAGSGERKKQTRKEKIATNSDELAAFLGIGPGEVPQGQEAVDFFNGLEALEAGGSVEDAIAAIGDAQARFVKGDKKKKKGKKEKKRVTSPTTVSEFFSAAARGELGPIADRTPSTSEIEPTVAIDITNNNFSFTDTFNIRGVGDPKGVASELVSQIKAEFDRRTSVAGQQLQTNLVR
jgi:hypothetical protein